MIPSMAEEYVLTPERYVELMTLAQSVGALVPGGPRDEFIAVGEPSLAVALSLDDAERLGVNVPAAFIDDAIRLCDPDDLYDDVIESLRERAKEPVAA